MKPRIQSRRRPRRPMLSPGHRLGPYEILSRIGSGGMGEVWRARDTRLERTVAIKVLGSGLADDAALRQRFEREARAISSLNHPNFCTLYDVGRQDGIDYLVMEHIEGETLASALSRGPLRIDACLRAGIEIAAALDRAHRAGVVHRDLKPGNVMLTKSGAKLLDFGLARIEGPILRSSDSAAARELLTQEGTILGTLQYMSPEQLRGANADSRSDLFAFGAVLYEMISGERAFSGADQASLIAAILDREPAPITSLAPSIHPALARAVSRCLEKDPEERWQSARDLMHELRWIAEQEDDGASLESRADRRTGARLPWTIAAIAILGLIAVAILARRTPRFPAPQTLRLAIARPPLAPYTAFDHAAVSPDGERIVFVAYLNDGTSTLWLRDLESEPGRALEGTEKGSDPFWSPDSRKIAFFADGKVKQIDVAGGPPTLVCDASGGSAGAWGPDGTILLGADGLQPLLRVPSSGGVPAPATQLLPKEEAHRWPSFLPDGRHFVYLADAWSTPGHRLKIGSLDGGEPKDFGHAVSNAVATMPGFLLFVRGSTLLAQRIDLDRLSPAADPVVIATHVQDIDGNHRFEFSTSRTGVLALRSVDPRGQLAWVARSGKKIESVGPVASIGDAKLSPDGKQIAYALFDEDGRSDSVWLLDLARKSSTRVAMSQAYDPVWAPDSERLAVGAMGESDNEIYLLDPSTPGSERRLISPQKSKNPVCWSPDGHSFVYMAEGENHWYGLWLVDPDRSEPGRPLVQASGNISRAQYSHDGKWLAYVSDDAGEAEVYVIPIPPTGKRWKVSSGGGDHPHWCKDSGEIVYKDAVGHLKSARIRAGAEPEISPSEELFDARPGKFRDLSADGERLLVLEPVEDWLAAPLTVISNWTVGLGAR